MARGWHGRRERWRSTLAATAPARLLGEARPSVTTASWARARRARGGMDLAGPAPPLPCRIANRRHVVQDRLEHGGGAGVGGGHRSGQRQPTPVADQAKQARSEMVRCRPPYGGRGGSGGKGATSPTARLARGHRQGSSWRGIMPDHPKGAKRHLSPRPVRCRSEHTGPRPPPDRRPHAPDLLELRLVRSSWKSSSTKRRASGVTTGRIRAGAADGLENPSRWQIQTSGPSL
jgi:hypothetical protein